MRCGGVLAIVAAAACAAPQGRPLAVPAAQALETFEPLIDCAGLAGLMASELPGAVEIRLDDVTTLRYYVAGQGYYVRAIVDEARVPEGEAPEREAIGMARGEELFSCARERRAADGSAQGLVPAMKEPPAPGSGAPAEH